ncbi:MAG: membrane protein [Methylibium sp. NZG]|nr:MAG: membrane protein [Methylibium sp. NZG]
MNRYVAGYLAAAAVMVVVDMLWLGVIAKSTYQQAIGHLMADKPNVSAAVVFYVLYTLGLMVFVLGPLAAEPSWGRTLLMGALFGFFAYATYDLSNFATLKGWPLRLVIIDMAWGSLLSAMAVGAGKAAMNWAAGR